MSEKKKCVVCGRRAMNDHNVCVEHSIHIRKAYKTDKACDEAEKYAAKVSSALIRERSGW